MFFLKSFISLFSIISSQNIKTAFKCNHNGFNNKIKPADIIIDNGNKPKKFNTEENFKDFNIYMDLNNFDYEVTKYNLQVKKNFFETGLRRAEAALENLLIVKKKQYNYAFKDNQILALNITKWDKRKVGTEAYNQNKGLNSFGIDLYLFVRFGDNNEMGEEVLASARAAYTGEDSIPIMGVVNINRDVDYSKTNSLRYLEGILVHEMTHVLGFSNYYFTNIKKMYYTQIDSNGIQKYYINSANVVNIAKNYFNCDTIKGIPLEDYGGQGTVGSHWDARVLLGDYMNGVIYPEEQVFSEFTLALLEDLGYYKANYYTGGLLKFGKNKGCAFLNERCIVNGKINEAFSNEFFDSIINEVSSSDPSCSSGRQSRTYHYLLRFSKQIPTNLQYYTDPYIGGWPSADYCPISLEDKGEETSTIYYVGHCSELGSGDYGTHIIYKENKYYKNGDLELYTGESYSNNSFCALSSLVSKNAKNYELFTNTTRGVCYQMFCSDRSLTIKINEDYAVCPRSGGKINLTNYDGYLLCPDYYLICSGTVLCNDMFDCLEKKSSLKNNIDYDYEIKTSQDISSFENEDFSEENYELSTNGICTQHCIHCKLNLCLSCRKGYGNLQFTEKSTTKRICKSYEELEHGYYKDENSNLYFKCSKNCVKCVNGKKCIECKYNYNLKNNGEVCEKKYGYIYIIIIVVAVILIIAIIFIIFRCVKKGKIAEDPNKISFHKDTNENLLYGSN